MIALAEPGRLTIREPGFAKTEANCGVLLPPAAIILACGFEGGPAISKLFDVPFPFIVVGEETFGEMDTPVVVPEEVRIGALPACVEIEGRLEEGEIDEMGD